MTDLQKFLRGQVWWQAQKDTQVVEGIIFGTRPVVIISDDKINFYSSALTVAPLTSSEGRKYYNTHVEFTDLKGNKSTILLDQIRTIPKTDLSTYMGTLPQSKMEEVEKAIKCALGMVKTQAKVEVVETEVAEPKPKPTIEVEIVDKVEEGSAEVAGISKRATEFTENEKTMIKKYLKFHNIAETMRFFKDKTNPMTEACLYQRIRRLKKEMEEEE